MRCVGLANFHPAGNVTAERLALLLRGAQVDLRCCAVRPMETIMTLEDLEEEPRDPFFDHWAPMLLVHAANAVALALLVLFWPAFALLDRLPTAKPKTA